MIKVNKHAEVQMFIIKDTESLTHQPSFFVKQDIQKRAKHAYNTNKNFFNCMHHQNRIAAAKSITLNYISSCAAIYTTARSKTKKREVHTELKFNKCVLNRKNSRNKFLQQISALGNIEVVYKPATNSYSLHIF